MNVSGGMEVKRIYVKQSSELKLSVVNKGEHKIKQGEEIISNINVHMIWNSRQLIMLKIGSWV